MLNLREYRRAADRLADHLPWAALVDHGVVLNKDGSFQRTIRFRGPDLESATHAELLAVSARLNNILKRFSSGWALFFDAERREAAAYPDSMFPDPCSRLVDLERQQGFTQAGRHFESLYHLTLLWLPPADQTDRARRWLLAGPANADGRDWREVLALFKAESDRVVDLMSEVMPLAYALDDEETLSFLHRTISRRGQRVGMPAIPVYLDALLADQPLQGGVEPRLGGAVLRTLTLTGFPGMTRPALLDALNNEAFAYRWTTRFIALDKADATRALTRLRRQWFNKRKSVAVLLREVLYNQQATLLDSDADNKVIDADIALQALGQDHVSYGYLTSTITMIEDEPARLADHVRAAQRVVHNLGFVTIDERFNAVEAWLSSLPGHVYANVRQPLVSSINLAHLIPMSAIWAGPDGDRHLDGPPLFQARAGGATPFRFTLHVGDVGHAMVVGPTGAGKSVLLAFMALQFRRYPQARIILFDKGLSARAVTLALGGEHRALGSGDSAFQPLRRIDRPSERRWAIDWVGSLLQQQGVDIDGTVRDAVWTALESLAGAPIEQRTLTGLSLLMPSQALRLALAPYRQGGAYGHLLDAASEDRSDVDVLCFETEELMRQPMLATPTLTYLFHRLEAGFDGRPTLLILDEAWLFLDDPLFAARIREWLKVLRKKNVAVVFATQSLADIIESSIAPAIIENCPQRMFLPNDRAIEPQARSAYDRFGLNERQIELVARATPKRHYYLQSARGNRLFELDLGPIARALCGTSGPAAQARIDGLLAQGGSERFLARFLASEGFGWAADIVETPQFQERKGEEQ
ncbi:conjugal transfer protein TrbE [Sphingomonas oryzagri]